MLLILARGRDEADGGNGDEMQLEYDYEDDFEDYIASDPEMDPDYDSDVSRPLGSFQFTVPS